MCGVMTPYKTKQDKTKTSHYGQLLLLLLLLSFFFLHFKSVRTQACERPSLHMKVRGQVVFIPELPLLLAHMSPPGYLPM